MGVVTTARGRRATAFAARLGRSARRLLRGLRLADAELSLVVVSDRTMRGLNRRYRGVDRPTDVLSFSQGEGPGAPPNGLLGDVVISSTRRDGRPPPAVNACSGRASGC